MSNVLKDLSNDLQESPVSGSDKEADQQQTEEPEPIVDTDEDGLTDIEELRLGTNPARVDTDFDGLSDWDEVKSFKTDPVNSDSDGDGYLDGIEVQNGYNPLGSGKLQSNKQ